MSPAVNVLRVSCSMRMFGLGDADKDVIESFWPHGTVDFGDVNRKSCNYISRYITDKQDAEKAGVVEFALMSRRPGVGGKFADKYKDEIYNRGFLVCDGVKFSVPKYYMARVFNNDERLAVRQKDVDEYNLEQHKKRLDNIGKAGYTKVDREEALYREGARNRVVGRSNLKVRTGH